MVFWKRELMELEQSGKSFSDIYKIEKKYFSQEIFTVEFIDGLIVNTTYSELFALSEAYAAELSCRFAGLEGRFLCIRMDNSPRWAAAFWGTLMAGFKPVLINTRLDEQSIAEAIENAGAIGVLCDKDYGTEGYTDIREFDTKGSFDRDMWADEAVLMSSGTTGDAKLVVFSGRAICEQILVSGWVTRQTPSVYRIKDFNIRLVALLPFNHIFGLSTVLMWFGFFGRTLIIPSSMDSEAIRYACKYGGATHFFAIPAVWNTATRLLQSEAKRQGRDKKLDKAVALSNSLQNVFPRFGAFVARRIFADVREQVFGKTLRFCISGGGFISDDALRIMNGIGYSMHNGYGMTETGITSVELSEHSRRRNENTVGKPFPIVDYKVDENGVLCLRSALLYSGVLSDGKVCLRDESAYFVTNDLCSVNKHGRLCLLGRLDDVIIGESGENINPDTVEQRIIMPPTVTFCIIGLDSGDSCGRRATAVISFPESFDSYRRAIEMQKLFGQIDKLPLSMRPARVFYTTGDIPVSLGKVKRASLVRMIADGKITLTPCKRPDGEDFTRMYDESFSSALGDIRGIFAAVLNISEDNVTDNSHFIYDLGGDSMSYYNLFSAISQRFDIPLRMDSSQPLFTPLDFADAVLAEEQALA